MTRIQWKSSLSEACQKWLGDVAGNLRKKSVWQPMLKNILSTTIAIIIGVNPSVVIIYGKSTHLGPLVSVFGQPGQRFGKMVESLCLIALGTLFGLGWGNLGLYLSSLFVSHHINAAWAIRAIFFIIAVILHGVLRSSTPRLFRLVLFFMIANLGVLAGSEGVVTLSAFKSVIYPVFTAVGVVILVNITVFPQFSSGFLGTSTIKTLAETIDIFQAASDWFMSEGGGDEEKSSPEAMRTRLAALTEMKPKLRTRLSSCKTAQAECNFELVLAVLPPRSLKPISVTMMTRLVQVTISLINACESKFALAAYIENRSASEESKGEKMDSNEIELDLICDERVADYQRNIDLIKPTRETESGDINVLEHIISQIHHPAKVIQDQIRDAVRLITSALVYCYDVSKLPSGYPKSDRIILKEMDIRMEIFVEALTKFDINSSAALESATATVHGRRDSMDGIAPRIETHLASSFLVNISQTAAQVLEMLKHARTLVERKQSRNGRRKLYWPRIGWKKWLTSGGEEDSNVLPENARKEARAGYGPIEDSRNRDDESATTSPDALLRPKTDEETGVSNSNKDVVLKKGKGPFHEGPQKSLTCNIILWYVSERGTWATQLLILLFEVSIGTTFLGFFLRALGTIFGCGIGIIAWEVGQGNRILLVIVLAIGLLPGSYIQWNTPYIKAGVIYMVSLSLVGIATVVRVNSDSPSQICIKRLVSFLIGGAVAVTVEMVIFPVRARDRLVESLASALTQISIMESFVAMGVDSPSAVDIKSHALNAHFKGAKEKAEQALDAAQTFLPFSLTEPRIESGYKGQALVYGEMIHVLFQIIERMENMLHIRKLYGNSVLEELHTEMLPYRRSVVGCVTLALFAVQEALTLRLPLPQFLPSSHVAQLRYVAHVRELLYARRQGAVAESAPGTSTRTSTNMSQKGSSAVTDTENLKSMTRQNLAWKASSAGMMEIIEYLEELVDLTKLLVGVNSFRSGVLERPKFCDYLAKIKARKTAAAAAKSKKAESEKTKNHPVGVKRRPLASFSRLPSVARPAHIDSGLRRRQSAVGGAAATGDSTLDYDDLFEEHENDIPWSLQRIMAKRKEESERLARPKTRELADPKGKHVFCGFRTRTG
ncbi:hypothetical protein HD806DRAFT_546290 [Xylariaceae sp. AK1471]|nr:hypothetical protein HD806DRAFT_546290 [Xylariaceae sp. AK1471]